ncbi:MAG TPA: hypothetical protein PLB76_12640, partial [Anaerohalosphaeraceae bacterium]|nr:hypothetical protein [Anaerohalosphaeraceae bacterium]
ARISRKPNALFSCHIRLCQKDGRVPMKNAELLKMSTPVDIEGKKSRIRLLVLAPWAAHLSK